ncbi:MAG: chromosomal replication initiator protein DnaA [Clostridium sp.]|nr:chromosomal replication initiator protein DnaA [Prevotella sp.]MCM1428844.1 chromosomal replication initiator protein DnaA [Clostridium sp.]MCM1475219.1 chromosomal replication initiator protein DnaA [Muribaculaceae bacterium]
MSEEITSKWQTTLRFVKDNLGEQRFATWFSVAEPIALNDNILQIKLPSRYFFDKYESDFYNLFRAALAKGFGNNVCPEYILPVINDDPKATVTLPSPEKSHLLKNRFEQTNFQKPAIEGKNLKGGEHFDPQLNPDLNFDNYCVGESNKLAYTIAKYVSENPKNSNFNPFFLFGDVGVGKTHLIQAIGIKIKEENPRAKVLFTTLKQFQTLYANATRTKKIPDFINWFMQMDVLLLDDLQEIAHKVKTSDDALFPIFNHLHQNGRQLVFTCDRPPMELDGIADRLIDRFKWGITERLPRPDADLRKKILTFKARKNGLDLPEDVIDLIASTSTTSVRELEGIVMGILTRCISLNVPISLDLAREVMENTVKIPVKKSVNFDMVVEATAEHFRINPDVIFSKSRVREVADARQIIMYLCNKLTGLSSVSIGAKLNRQHATVLHGINCVKERIDSVQEIAIAISEIETSLK